MAASLVVVRAAYAQPPSAPDPAGAEALFEEGRALFDAGSFTQARLKFEASQALEPAAATLIWIARCFGEEERYASERYAYESARKLLLLAPAERRRPDLEQVVEVELPRNKEKVPLLKVIVPNPPTGLRVMRDGALLEPGAFDTALPMDPGRVQIVAEAPGYLRHETVVDLAPGESHERIILMEPTPHSALMSPLGKRAPDIPRLPVSRSRSVEAEASAWSFFGSAMLSGVTSAALGIATAVRMNESSDHCDAENFCDSRGIALRAEASALQVGAYVLLGTSAALAGAGTAIFVATTPSEPTISFTLMPTGAGLRGLF